MLNENPLVSVCIPTFNAEKHIKKTIDSVLAQSYQNLQLIILDDCSTDSTMKIIKSIDDPRIEIFENETNLGPQETWSKLIDLAGGVFFKIVCHDDVLYPECIAVQVQALIENEDVVLVASNRDIIDKNDKVIFSPKRFRKNIQVLGERLLLSSLRKGTNTVGEPHAVMIRLDVIRNANLRFEGNFYLIDLAFYSKVLMLGDAFILSRTLSAFRVYRETASYRLSMSQAACFIGFVNKLRAGGIVKVPLFDYWIGCVGSLSNQVSRFVFYKIFL
ncbi:glycosyltransferase family 2 protein [Porticoccus sp.]